MDSSDSDLRIRRMVPYGLAVKMQLMYIMDYHLNATFGRWDLPPVGYLLTKAAYQAFVRVDAVVFGHYMIYAFMDFAYYTTCCRSIITQFDLLFTV